MGPEQGASIISSLGMLWSAPFCMASAGRCCQSGALGIPQVFFIQQQTAIYTERTDLIQVSVLGRVDECLEGHYMGSFRNTFSESMPGQTVERFHMVFFLVMMHYLKFYQRHCITSTNSRTRTLPTSSDPHPLSYSFPHLKNSHFLSSTSIAQFCLF